MPSSTVAPRRSISSVMLTVSPSVCTLVVRGLNSFGAGRAVRLGRGLWGTSRSVSGTRIRMLPMDTWASRPSIATMSPSRPSLGTRTQSPTFTRFGRFADFGAAWVPAAFRAPPCAAFRACRRSDSPSASTRRLTFRWSPTAGARSSSSLPAGAARCRRRDRTAPPLSREQSPAGARLLFQRRAPRPRPPTPGTLRV